MAKTIDLRKKAGAGGSGVDPVGLKNIAGTTIDPATEPKQDAIIAAINAISIGGGGIGEKLLQVDSVGSTTYLGYANAGSLTSAAVWAIKRIIETGPDASITWADGNTNFDNIWDNRLALTYA